MTLRAPFPYFGGKSTIADEVWARLGEPKQYIEPFCGSAAMLLAATKPASLEVAGDVNCWIANFWRTVKNQPDTVAAAADYPVSHIDLHARHAWLTQPERVQALAEALSDPEWPGDAKIAGWWVWGQCAWIGSGWCEPCTDGRTDRRPPGQLAQIPFVGHAGLGVQRARCRTTPTRAAGCNDASQQKPFLSSTGMGIQRCSFDGTDGIRGWFRSLSQRLARVRLIHGDWSRCMNHHYGAEDTAVFFDPPYVSFERLYGRKTEPVALAVAKWCAEHAELRVALCGHVGDYESILPAWPTLPWSRGRLTYGGGKTTDEECVWFSPSCVSVRRAEQLSLLDSAGGHA